MMKKLAPLLPFVAATLWGGSVFASTSFPAQVDQHLGLQDPKKVEDVDGQGPDGDGCLLCHTTLAGGLGTNNQFGQLLLRNGAVADEPGTIGPALDAIKMSDPTAIDDIEMGINPNDDPQAFVGQPPQPSYGCDVAGSTPGREESLAAVSLCGAFAFAASRRRQRSQ
jgi:hypothetical protein